MTFAGLIESSAPKQLNTTKSDNTIHKVDVLDTSENAVVPPNNEKEKTNENYDDQEKD